MEPFSKDSGSAASAPTQGPPQPVAISSTLTNASPNGTSGHDNEQQNSENETSSPYKDGGRVVRRNRLSVESLTCSSCGKVCSNKSKYMRHLSTHSEERPYSCPLCKKGFKWVEYLSKHMKQQHPNSTLAPVDITTTTTNAQSVTSPVSEENVVGINLEINLGDGDAPSLLQGRLTIPTPVSLLPSLKNGEVRDGPSDQHQSNDATEKSLHPSTTDNDPTVTKDTIPVGQASSQECSGTFQNLYQSPAVIICSTEANTSTTQSIPVTTIANRPNSVVMKAPEEPTTFTVTSSCESLTFAVPVLSQGMSAAASTSVTSLISQLSSVTDTSFNGGYSNNSSFNQPGGFSSDNAIIVPDTINCQLASSLTNSDIQANNVSSEMHTADSPGDVVKKYICEQDGCTKTYRYKKDVIRHMKMKHGSQPTRYEQKEVPEMLLRKHACEQCDKMYAHRKDLLRHQRDVHSPEAIARREASKSNQKKYPCEQPNCNKFYVHKKDLIRHRRNDHNDFTDTKEMHIPEPVSPSQYSASPNKRQRTNWSSGKVVSAKAETVSEPITASDVPQWLGVTVVKEGNVTAAIMATSDSNTSTLASNCALFNTSPSSSSAATSLLSLLNSASQQSLPVDSATAQLMGQASSVHPLFSAVTSNAQGSAPAVSTAE